jgi:uncharacterized protein
VLRARCPFVSRIVGVLSSLAVVSKTKMRELVRAFQWKEVARALDENPELLAVRDEKGRNWLHICCAASFKGSASKARDSIKTAEILLRKGLAINQEAFTEGNWKATPLWYAIARPQNLKLAEYLLKQGSSPNYCLWAASYQNNIAAIRLLVSNGADVNDRSVDESPLLGAIKWSRFKPAEELLKLGADPDYRDRHGMTALHYMLKKGSDKRHFAMLVAAGARGDIADSKGITAIEIMRRKRDPDFRRTAGQLAAGGATRTVR